MPRIEPRRPRTLVAMAVAVLALAVSGCDEAQLYSNLPERDVNEMMAALLRHGIAASKQAGEEGTWTLMVPKDGFAESIRLLDAIGLPRPRGEGLGEAFKKSGLISSPGEERIRFVAALSHELEETLAQFEGVVAARVHIVLPENDPLGERLDPSRASVFLRHLEGADLEARVDEIKSLVVNSIEGLDREKVAVYLSATPRPRPPSAAATPPAPRRSDWLLVGVGALIVVNVGSWLILGLRGRFRRRPASATAPAHVAPAGKVALPRE